MKSVSVLKKMIRLLGSGKVKDKDVHKILNGMTVNNHFVYRDGLLYDKNIQRVVNLDLDKMLTVGPGDSWVDHTQLLASQEKIIVDLREQLDARVDETSVCSGPVRSPGETPSRTSVGQEDLDSKGLSDQAISAEIIEP